MNITKNLTLTSFQTFTPQNFNRQLEWECNVVFQKHEIDFINLASRVQAGEDLEKKEYIHLLALLVLKYASTKTANIINYERAYHSSLYRLVTGEHDCCYCWRWCWWCWCKGKFDCAKCLTFKPPLGRNCLGYPSSDLDLVMKLFDKPIFTAKGEYNKLFLIHKSTILHAKAFKPDLQYENLRKENKIMEFTFQKYPKYTFISHKWFGDSPDNSDSLFLKYLQHLTDTVSDEFFWIDFCCFQQEFAPEDEPKRLTMLATIPDIILGSSHVELFRMNADYQNSVWCTMESVTKIDDGFINHNSMNIKHLSDFENVMLPLCRMCMQITGFNDIIARIADAEELLKSKPKDVAAASAVENARLDLQQHIAESRHTVYFYRDGCCSDSKSLIAHPLLWLKNPALAHLSLFYFIKYQQEEEHLKPFNARTMRSMVSPLSSYKKSTN